MYFRLDEDTMIVHIEVGSTASLCGLQRGWTEVVECFEEFFKMKNFVMVRGNHDQWLKNWLQKGEKPDVWTLQGGKNTLDSYAKYGAVTYKRHLGFLKTTKHYFVDEKNRLYVHGGYKIGVPMELQDKMLLMWDREFRENPMKCFDVHDFTEVFVGHTTIWKVSQVPIKLGRVNFMDTGGGWEGKLSLMNVDTRDVFQSDLVSELYPNVRPR